MAHLFLKLINDPYLEHQVRYAYLIVKTSTDFGELYRVVGCFICEKMGDEGRQTIR